MQTARAAIDESADVDIRAGQAFGLRGLDVGDVGSAALPLLCASAGAQSRLLGMNALDPSGAASLGFEAEALDESEHEIRRPAGETPQPFAALATERALDFIGVVFEAGNQLSAVAAGGAPARRLGFEDDGVSAGLGDVERRGKAEIAGADDEDLRVGGADERLKSRRRDRRFLPKVSEAAHAQ